MSLRMRNLRWIAWMFTLALLAFSGQAEARSDPPLFGAKAIGSDNWTFKKGVVPDWRAMLGRWKDGAPCESNICTTKNWSALVEQVKSAGDPMSQIKMANKLMNAKPYIEDGN